MSKLQNKRTKGRKNLKNFPDEFYNWRHVTWQFIIIKRNQGEEDKEKMCELEFDNVKSFSVIKNRNQNLNS